MEGLNQKNNLTLSRLKIIVAAHKALETGLLLIGRIIQDKRLEKPKSEGTDDAINAFRIAVDGLIDGLIDVTSLTADDIIDCIEELDRLEKNETDISEGSTE